jgi:hypothetical protein
MYRWDRNTIEREIFIKILGITVLFSLLFGGPSSTHTVKYIQTSSRKNEFTRMNIALPPGHVMPKTGWRATL